MLSSLLSAIIYIITASISIFLAIMLHELGHLVCGFVSGYEFSLFRFLIFTLTKESGKLKLKISKNSFILGQCLMKPPVDEKKFKFILYNLGGGLFNLISGIIVLFVWLFAKKAHWIFSATELVFAIASLYFAAVNLIPLIASGIPNDGMNIKQGLKSNDAKHGFYVLLSTNADIIMGKRYSDMNPEPFTVRESADLSNYLSSYPLFIAAERYVDLGQYDEALKVFDNIDENKFPQYYQASIKLDKLYYYSAINTDKEKAKYLYADKYLQKMLHSALPSCPRILAAYEFFINSKKDIAEQLMKHAKAVANSLPGGGAVTMEKDRIKELEELINAAQAA